MLQSQLILVVLQCLLAYVFMVYYILYHVYQGFCVACSSKPLQSFYEIKVSLLAINSI